MGAPATKQSRTGALLRVVRFALVTYLLVVLAMTFIERLLVYPAPPLDWGDWSPEEPAFEDVWIEVPGGERVHGWFFDRPGASRSVLYCHGNGEHVAYHHDSMKRIGERLDAAVLNFDYPGYGKSPGKPSERSVLAAAEAAQRWLAERTGRGADGVTLMGCSLGGGVAIALAADVGAEALVVERSFTRLVDAAAQHYPWLPVRWVMRNRYDSLSRIARYRGPLWISHGTGDRVVPFEHAARLLEAAERAGPKRIVEQPGLGHNDPMPSDYYREMRVFLDSARVSDPTNPAE